MSTSLLVDAGGHWATNIRLAKGRKTKIGRRTDNDLRLNDMSVSGHHATIFYEDGAWKVQDHDTPNGTCVNGIRVKQSELRNGDIIRISSTDIVFKDKATAIPDDVWGKTSLSFLQDQGLILTESKSGAQPVDDAPISLPGLQEQRAPQQRQVQRQQPQQRQAASTGGYSQSRGESSSEYGSYQSPPSGRSEDDFLGFEFQGSPLPRGGDDLSSTEYKWLADQASRILGQMASQRGMEKAELYDYVVGLLCDTIGADNGCLSVPNRRTKRWVIEAWHGSSGGFGQGQVPEMPLSLINQAYRQDDVVSNATGTGGALGGDASASMINLQVNNYIAVPLHHRDERAGVLYFDTRQPNKVFGQREVRLIQQVGDYIMELDYQLRGPEDSRTGSGSAFPMQNKPKPKEGDPDWLFGGPADDGGPSDHAPIPTIRGGSEPPPQRQATPPPSRRTPKRPLAPPEQPAASQSGEDVPSSFDIPWPELLENEIPSSSVPLSIRRQERTVPEDHPAFSDRIERLRHYEFALLLPVDRPIKIKSVVSVLLSVENMDAEKAEKLIVDRKGIVAENLSFDRVAQIYKQAGAHHEHILCVAVPEGLRPGPVIEARGAELHENGLRYTTARGHEQFTWSQVKLLSCGRLERRSAIDLFLVKSRQQIRLRHGVLNLGDLVGNPNGEMISVTKEILMFIKEHSKEAVRSHTVSNFLKGKTPKPQKFASEKDYHDFNMWLLLAHYGEQVDLEEVYHHSTVSA